METTITVRPAAHDDIPDLAGVLGRAFHDDAIWAWLVPDADRRVRLIDGYMEVLLRKLYFRLPGRHVSTTSTRAGVAMWVEPDCWRVPILRALPAAPGMIRIFGLRTLARLGGFLSAIEKHHPKEPHWYLEGLGTDPPHQRTGVGSALMQPILDRCDREGLPAYLETQKLENVAYYRRHGFEVREELDLPKDGPHVWLMWREPRSE